MIKNSLHALLGHNYPSYKKFFARLTAQSAIAFYETYPSARHLENVSVEELALFLKTASKGQNSIKKAELILTAVENDNVPVNEFQDAQDFNILSLIRQIKNNLDELDEVNKQIEKLLNHFDLPLRSMKGIDVLTEAKIISEIGDISRFKNAAALAKYAGVAPVTYASGMSALQMANARGNRKLNDIFFKIALTTITPFGTNKVLVHPIFYDYYQKKISEGKTKMQALKCVQRRLVNIIYNMMKHQRPYENLETSYLKADVTNAKTV